MLTRCSRASTRNLGYSRHNLRISVAQRFNSSVPERTRKLSADQNPFSRFVRDWLLNRWVLAGVISAVVLNEYVKRGKNGSFATYTLAAKERVSSTASIFRLEPKQQSDTYELYKEAWRKGIWNVQFKQPQLQIVRAYTPLPPLDDKRKQERGDLRFLIRHDPHGEVSSYLHRLPLSAEIEMRGPYLEYEITPEVQEIVFLAGGTGIAPALQAAYALLEGNKSTEADQSNKTRKMHILWASRTREDCVGGISDEPPPDHLPAPSTWSGLFSKPKPNPVPATPISSEKGLIVQEIEALKQRYPDQVTVEYFVNTEDTWINEDAVVRALARFGDKQFSSNSPPKSDTAVLQRQILISGPPGFIGQLAGPKEWRNGREEQGALGKVVAHALSKCPHDVKVWKI